MHDLRLALDDVVALLTRDGRVLEKATGIAHHRRVGQFGAAYLANPIKYLLRCDRYLAGLRDLAVQVGIAQHRLPGLGQSKAHARDQRPARQPESCSSAGRRTAGMLEHRVAVAKSALRGVQREGLAGLQVHRVQRLKAVLQLDAVSAYVLHRRSAHAARDHGQVLHAWVSIGQRPGHQLVPVFPSASLDNEGFGGFAHQPLAHDLDLEHQGFDVAGEHNVAAAAQNELRHCLQRRVGQHGGQVGLGADAHQAQGLGHNAKAVVGLQGDIFLD